MVFYGPGAHPQIPVIHSRRCHASTICAAVCSRVHTMAAVTMMIRSLFTVSSLHPYCYWVGLFRGLMEAMASRPPVFLGVHGPST